LVIRPYRKPRQIRLEVNQRPVSVKVYVHAKLHGLEMRQQARDARRKRAARAAQERKVK
jgi:hypothetical protein